MSLSELLKQHLSTVLPKTPAEAIGATELIERLHPFIGDRNENTLRAYFSWFAQDLTSPIAKVDQGQGYYLRPPMVEEGSLNGDDGPPDTVAAALAPGGRDRQPEEKFRAFFIKWAQQEAGVQGVLLDHTRARRQPKGIGEWKYPDVALIKWYDLLEDAEDDAQSTRKLDATLVQTKQSLGEAPYRVTSVELKVDADAGSVRKIFFQCVSNSRWAHAAQLAIAKKVTDETVANELRRLGSSYGIQIVTFGVTDLLDTFESADVIRNMGQGDFENAIKGKINVEVISPGVERETLDWEHIKDVKRHLDDFGNMFRWIEYCLREGTLFTFDSWQNFFQHGIN